MALFPTVTWGTFVFAKKIVVLTIPLLPEARTRILSEADRPVLTAQLLALRGAVATG
jgi:hypothetical protein